MRRLVLGTAGHVDHGKTKLTEALTGTDTDRLPEEKARGITIEPGFARLTLPGGQALDIVDVPGHEKLIRNMLAGASGVDAVLLAVAADEGVMPQTREHLNILSLLGVQSGVVAVTKTDLADLQQLTAVQAEIRAAVRGTFLEGAALVPVSARTGEGLSALVEALDRLADAVPPRVTDRPFRLPIDRAFTVSGSGLVVTGTLSDGSVSVGDSVTLYPAGKPVRIRELQHGGERLDALHAGMRAAANLPGVEKSELGRGALLAQPGSVALSTLVTVRLTVCKDAAYPIKNASNLHFYLGTQERIARVRILEGDALLPGESGFAQLSFSEPLAARNLDRFIVRFFSPVITVGGGVVVEVDPPRLKRNRPEILSRLTRLAASPEARILDLVEKSGCVPIGAEALCLTSGLRASEVRASLGALAESGDLVPFSEGYLSRSVLDKIKTALVAALAACHEQNPLSPGMRLSELRERVLPAPQRAADAVLRYFAANGAIVIDGPYVSLPGFAPAYAGERLDAFNALTALYRASRFTPPANDEAVCALPFPAALVREVLASMLQNGALVALTPSVSMHRDAYAEALSVFVGLFEGQNAVTLAEYRTALGASRKYARMILELFDRRKISSFRNDARTLLKRSNS